MNGPVLARASGTGNHRFKGGGTALPLSCHAKMFLSSPGKELAEFEELEAGRGANWLKPICFLDSEGSHEGGGGQMPSHLCWAGDVGLGVVRGWKLCAPFWEFRPGHFAPLKMDADLQTIFPVLAKGPIFCAAVAR